MRRLAVHVEAQVHLLRVDPEDARLEHCQAVAVVEPLHVHEVLEELEEVELVAEDALLLYEGVLQPRVGDRLGSRPCAVRRERGLHLLPACAVDGVDVAQHGLHALLGERRDRVGVAGVDAGLKRKGLLRLLYHKRCVLGGDEVLLDDGLHRRERGVGVGGRGAERQNLLRLPGLLPGCDRLLVVFARLGLRQVRLAGEDVFERRLVRVGRRKQGVEVYAFRLQELDRRDDLRRADASVAVCVHEFKHPAVEPHGLDGHGDRQPVLLVERRQICDVLAVLEFDLGHATGPEPTPVVVIHIV